MRETFLVDASTQRARIESQKICLASLKERLFEPYERAGHRVDIFLTVYRHLGGPRKVLLEPLGDRLMSTTTVQQASTPSQLLPLAVGVRAFLAWCSKNDASYAAVVVTRFDLYLKADLQSLLGDAIKIDGFRFLFRESGGHWRHHSQREATNRTFGMKYRSTWRSNPRAPDALLAFPFAYTRCFLAATRNELFPLRNESRPLSFLHNMIPGLMRALPDDAKIPRLTYLVEGQFDSNPCRATCMLNPIYDLQPRMRWILASNICQRMEDYVYDPASKSVCCPSPNYCCPNSVSSCRDPGAFFFDIEKAQVPMDAVINHWPLQQNRPFSWEMTPRSRKIVYDAWMHASSDPSVPMQDPQRRLRLRVAAQKLMASTTFRRRGE